MKVSIILPSLARKALGGHKVIYEYSNYLVKRDDISVNIYFMPGNSLKKYIKSEFLRKNLLNLYLKWGNAIKWFDLDNRINLRVIRSVSEIENSDIVVATGVETLNPILNLPEAKGRKVYFIQDFENWHFSDGYVLSTYTDQTLNIVVSKWLYDIVSSQTKNSPVLISNNINTSIFYSLGKKRISHSVIFHYRNAPHKGCEYAIQAIKQLKAVYSDLNVAVVSSQEKPDSLPSWCSFYKNIPAQKVAELNNQYQVFMCTSIDEGFGLPGLEAMACGCAVVSTRYKGVLEYAIDGKNALLSEPKDVDTMVANIVRLFEDDELRKRITENGIKTGKERTLEKSAQKFEKIITGKIDG